MVIGNGLLAQTFAHYKNNKKILIFASGVSNSTEIKKNNFIRERDLLSKTLKKHSNYKIIYFSTISIEDPSVRLRPYIQHKLEMENLIKSHSLSYLIFRVSNVVGFGGNSNTIMNYLVNAVKDGIHINVWTKAERNLIDQIDVRKIADKLIEEELSSRIVNIATRESLLVTDILNLIESHFNKKVNADFFSQGLPVKIDVTDITSVLDQIEITSGKGSEYINRLLVKYY